LNSAAKAGDEASSSMRAVIHCFIRFSVAAVVAQRREILQMLARRAIIPRHA